MKILAITGALGAGKTTLVLSLLNTLQTSGIDTKTKVAYVLNDAGLLVDGQVASDRAQVIAMTNGCFTCENPQELRKELTRINETEIELVIMEGFGGIAGNETRDFLRSVPYPFHIFTVISCKHYRADLLCYADVLKSQVKAATLGVGITKCPPGISLLTLDSSSNLDAVMDFISAHNGGVPTTIVQRDEVPQVLLNLFMSNSLIPCGEKGSTSWTTSHLIGLMGRARGDQHCCDHHCHEHGHVHGHHCEHHHGQNSVHGTFFPYWFALKPDTTLREIKLAFADKDYLLRIKGATERKEFKWVHGDWTEGVLDDRLYVTFYSSKEIDVATDLPLLARLIQCPESPDSSLEGPGYQQLRQETGTREETVALIQHMLQGLPTKPVLTKGSGGERLRLITHPETMQRLKDGIARRPSVKEEWFPIVLRHCMEYWIKCVRYLQDHSNKLEPGDIARHKRELTGSMVWWTNRYADAFGPEVVEEVNSLGLGTLAAEGTLALTELNSEEDRARWECDEITEALLQGIKHGENHELILEAAKHCLTLAKTEASAAQWSTSVQMLTEAVSAKS